MIRMRMFDLVEKATVREGLINLLEGGYNVIGAVEYPTTLDLELVASVEVDIGPESDVYKLDLRFELTCDDGEPTGIDDFHRKGTLTRRGSSDPESNAVVLPFVIDTSELEIPRPGSYRFSVYDHDEHVTFIRLFAERTEAAG